LHTTQIQRWTRLLREGDRAAPDELVRAAAGRLEALARKMLRGFPGVRRYEQTDDVLQGALLRLLRALREVEPASVREFFGLAAEQLRRELLDLSRHHYGPHGRGAHEADVAPRDGAPPPEPVDDAVEPAELERWSAFHEGVAGLPAEEREVVGLVFYHGWTQVQIAELFGVVERTVRRRWQSACLRLSRLVGD
jgi:RNA polymerase sigma-70 factor (ECF subfamily)